MLLSRWAIRTLWLKEFWPGLALEYGRTRRVYSPAKITTLRNRMLDAESQGWQYSKAWVESHRLKSKGVDFVAARSGRAADSSAGRQGRGVWGVKTEKRVRGEALHAER